MTLHSINLQNEYDRPSEPVVSVIVMTYNSSKYILETLESTKSQTYRNLELIVTDDCSGDETVELVEKWMENNRDRFLNCELIKTPVNTGIPSNCNRGLIKSCGEWVKIIAGDDILLDTCVSSFISYLGKSSGLRFIASDMHYINADSEIVEYKDFRYNAIRGHFFSLNPDGQLRLYARFPLFLNSPSFFMHKATLQSVDYFDEEFRFYDDLPLIFRILEKGIRIDYLDKKTVKYRIYENSLSRTSNKMTSAIRINEQIRCFKKYRRSYLNRFNLIDLTVIYDFWLDHNYHGVIGIKALPLMYLLNFYQSYLDHLARKYTKSVSMTV